VDSQILNLYGEEQKVSKTTPITKKKKKKKLVDVYVRLRFQRKRVLRLDGKGEEKELPMQEIALYFQNLTHMPQNC
jgi:hypothetical protein